MTKSAPYSQPGTRPPHNYETSEFYDYWRKCPFKISAQVQRQLQRLLTATQDELAQLRARQDRAD
ncbi:MAG: hypothetical protein ACRDRJ_36410 [Streptosporangiaceae bacterium]